MWGGPWGSEPACQSSGSLSFFASSQPQHLQHIKNISLLQDFLTTPSVLFWPWWRQNRLMVNLPLLHDRQTLTEHTANLATGKSSVSESSTVESQSVGDIKGRHFLSANEVFRGGDCNCCVCNPGKASHLLEHDESWLTGWENGTW